jgi:Ca2+-transporting ATPase
MTTDATPPASPSPPVAVAAWHALDVEQAVERLGSDADRGLPAAEAARRLQRHGPNALREAPRRPWWALVARQFRSPLIYILFVAATLALALGHVGDAGVILAVVVANALIGAFQEGRAERSMAALRRLAELQARVVRDGVEQALPARDLVPGDLLLLAAGDAVGADARLVEVQQLQVAEAALTGESAPVDKLAATLPEATGLADRHDMVYAATHVTAGRAKAVVVGTGADTEVGRIAALTAQAVEPPTPLERRIAQFGRWLIGAALALFALIVVLGLLRDVPLADLLMVAISQMVSMVPEGLPVAMTIALAVGMQRMAARGAIIRRLSAVETLGSTTVICSDKTGTLTRNEMTASALWLPPARDDADAGRAAEVGGSGFAARGGFGIDVGDPALQALLRAAVLCNDAQWAPGADGTPRVAGDPTEVALLVLAAKAGLDVAALRDEAPREAELPFDASAKLMATRHREPGAPRAVVVKGAPEAVLRLCAADGPAVLHAARAGADAMAARALRVLAVARVDDAALDPADGFDALVGRARLLGLVGEIDPPREEAKAAVAACRGAGIRPVMVTGDHKLTGLAIARELGIAREGDRALDGEELERLNDAELAAEIDRVAVFARVHPAQKLRIVEALQARGETVAMTGDGVNDAPALARADVGVAMGITGTEVAKSAARIVITDDDFATIVGAVEQGRVVYANLKKVILYLFATSVDEVVVLLLALLGGYPLPLQAVQILWINIVTEATLTVNLVMEPPHGSAMQRPPVPRDDRLVDRGMLARIALMAGAAVVATFGWFVWRLAGGAPIDVVRTETFTVLAMCQWFNVMNCQSSTASSLTGALLRNRWLLGGLALSVVLQGAVIYTAPMNALFHTVPIPVADLPGMIAAASLVLWIEEGRKLVVRAQLRQRSARTR